jgi:hypothetical protein
MYRFTVAILLGAGALATAYVQYRRVGGHRDSDAIGDAMDLVLAFIADDLAVILSIARLTPP